MIKEYVECLRQMRSEKWLPSMCHFFLGNEACDADSMISSLCHAYYSHRKQTTYRCIPVWHIKRDELYLRRDVALLLQMIDIDINDLICLTDIPNFASADTSSPNRVSLLDHNVLHASMTEYDLALVEIHDHHMDAGEHDSLQGPNRNIAFDRSLQKQLVGSTCTLIAENFFASPEILSPDVATLLLGVIALDTFNMDPTSIGTARDAEALEKLALISRCDRKYLYDAMRNAKLDLCFWKSLTAEHALALDYKQFKAIRCIGMSSVLLPIEEFLAKQYALRVIEEKMAKEDLKLFVVLSFVLEPVKTREILLVSDDNRYIKKLAEYMARPEMGLELVLLRETCDDIYTCVFSQLNLKASRKQVAPIVLDFDRGYV